MTKKSKSLPITSKPRRRKHQGTAYSDVPMTAKDLFVLLVCAVGAWAALGVVLAGVSCLINH